MARAGARVGRAVVVTADDRGVVCEQGSKISKCHDRLKRCAQPTRSGDDERDARERHHTRRCERRRGLKVELAELEAAAMDLASHQR